MPPSLYSCTRPREDNSFLLWQPIVLFISTSFECTVSTGGRTVTSLPFADDIDGLAEEEEELAKLVECLDKASTASGMEISAEKTVADDKQHQWHQRRDQGKWTEAWDSHKLHVPGLSYNWWGFQAWEWDTLQNNTDSSSIDTLETSLEWWEYSLNFKIRLMRSLVTSICLDACESWTLTAELQRRIQVMEMRCYCKILHILYKDHFTNQEVHAKIQQAIRPHKDLLTTDGIVRRRKL